MRHRTVPVVAVCAAALGGALGGAAGESFRPRSMAYVLQADKLAGNRPAAVEQLAQCGRDLVVIDYSHSGDAEGKWTPQDIRAIRAGKPGRKVLAYISIGEAEDYRPYWQKGWDRNRDGRPDKGAPAFLCPANPDWEGNYRVRYWHKDWQEIILRYVDEIIAQGFDGLYMDIVDAFEFFEEDNGRWIDNRRNDETKNTYRQDMVRWILKIAAHARRRQPDMLVVPQNGSQLLAFPEYLQAISAIGIEDLFTNGNKLQKREETDYVLRYLAKAAGARKPVLVIEYGRSAKARKASIEGAKANGFVLLLTDRNLKTLGTAGGLRDAARPPVPVRASRR